MYALLEFHAAMSRGSARAKPQTDPQQQRNSRGGMYLPTLTRTAPSEEERTQHEGVSRRTLSNCEGLLLAQI